MLTRSALSAAYPLAERLAAQGIALRPVNNTPLSELIAASSMHQNALASAPKGSFDGETVPDFTGLLIESSTYADPTGTCQHDDVMEASVKTIAESVGRNLNLAQNIVNPMVEQVVADTTAYMDSRAQTSLSPLSVVPFYYKAIWDSPILADLVSKYASVPVEDVRLNLTIPKPGVSVNDLLTGAGRFDTEVATFVQDVGMDTVLSVWGAVFGGQAGSLLEEIRGNYQAADRAVIVYLFARRLLEEIPDGLNMDVSAYKAYISTILAQAGRAVVLAYTRRQNDVRMQTLVLAMPPAGSSLAQTDILVLGDVYDLWLREGGTPEVLFGSAVSDRQTSYLVLLGAKDRYIKEWQQLYALLQSKASMVRFETLIEGLRQAMLKAIAGLTVDQAILEPGAYHARLKERLSHVKPKDVSELWHIARKAVCRVIFPHTDAELVLNAIEASCQAHPELEVREAALLATIDFVATWVSKLYTVDIFSELQ